MESTTDKAKPPGPPTETPTLDLTQEQVEAAELWHTIEEKEELATALGISPEVLTEWENQKRFIVEIAADATGREIPTQEKQAATLLLNNLSYAKAESIIGLKAGTIKQWVLDEESTFNWLLEGANELLESKAEDQAVLTTEQEPDPEHLSEEQLQAIPLLIEGKTDAEVGEAIGKSRETINRWRNHDKNFGKQLKAARKTYLDSQLMALSTTKGKAITVLNDLLESDDEKIKLQAATLLINAKSSLPQKPIKLKSFKKL